METTRETVRSEAGIHHRLENAFLRGVYRHACTIALARRDLSPVGSAVSRVGFIFRTF